MLFNSAQFAVFFGLLLLVYHALPRGQRGGLLLGASLLFLAASRYYPADAARVERVALVPEDRPPA